MARACREEEFERADSEPRNQIGAGDGECPMVAQKEFGFAAVKGISQMNRRAEIEAELNHLYPYEAML